MDFSKVKSFFIGGQEVVKACVGDTVVWVKSRLLKAISGNSLQDGEPTPDTPVEIQFFGKKTDNGYEIPVSIEGNINFYNQNATKFTDGYYISSTNIEKTDIKWYITDYIQITGTSFILHKDSTTGVAPSICLYDKDKNFITGVSYNKNDDIIISAKDTNKIPAYARFSIYKSQVGNPITLTNYEQTTITLKQPLRKVEEYADEITPTGIIRRVIEYQLDGTTAGHKLTSSGSASYFVRGILSNLKNYIPNLKSLSSTRSVLMSNQYSYSSTGTASPTAFVSNSTGVGQLYIVHSNQELKTTDALNEQLAVDKPTFYFPIEDTLDEEFVWEKDIEIPYGFTITFDTTVQPSGYVIE